MPETAGLFKGEDAGLDASYQANRRPAGYTSGKNSRASVTSFFGSENMFSCGGKAVRGWQQMDVVVPIVFPDYLIAIASPDISVDLPRKMYRIRIPSVKAKIPELGHAGVLMIKGSSGLTKYYEYGRYDSAAKGLVRSIPLPDAMSKSGKIDQKSLRPVLRAIADRAGQGGRILGVYVEVENGFDAMLTYAQSRERQNIDKNRRAYDILSYSCIHFVKSVVEAGGVGTPWIVDPRPKSYIGEFREDYPDLDYDKKNDLFTIE